MDYTTSPLGILYPLLCNLLFDSNSYCIAHGHGLLLGSIDSSSIGMRIDLRMSSCFRKCRFCAHMSQNVARATQTGTEQPSTAHSWGFRVEGSGFRDQGLGSRFRELWCPVSRLHVRLNLCL